MSEKIQNLFDKLVLTAAILATCLVVLGAYVRLSDAGLGCPDWPGCYGHITVPHGAAAQIAYPDKPLEAHKAWKEMVHRYVAGTLGLLILSIFITAWRGKGRLTTSPIMPTMLLGLVIFQALLGMWTVTLLLKPVIVSAHLLGGMTTLGVLYWMTEQRWGKPITQDTAALKPWTIIGLVILAGQIFLGGWTSSNYAALACTEFPHCQGAWVPQMDFFHAFHLVRDLGVNADGSQLSPAALTAIHWTHRLGALITFTYLAILSHVLLRHRDLRRLGMVTLVLLLIQVALGISNVLLHLPLVIAVGHNAGAALLLISLVMINSRAARGMQR